MPGEGNAVVVEVLNQCIFVVPEIEEAVEMPKLSPIVVKDVLEVCILGVVQNCVVGQSYNCRSALRCFGRKLVLRESERRPRGHCDNRVSPVPRVVGELDGYEVAGPEAAVARGRNGRLGARGLGLLNRASVIGGWSEIVLPRPKSEPPVRYVFVVITVVM